MQKILLSILMINLLTSVYSQQVGSPIVDQNFVGYANSNSNFRFDSFDIKTIIYNGNIDLLNKLSTNGLIDIVALGMLNRDELKVLRNIIYAKYSYKFQSIDLSNHFSNFKWYNPLFDNVDDKISVQEKIVIDQIRQYENIGITENNSNINLIGTWDEFNGGADQAANSFIFTSASDFIFIYNDDFAQKIKRISGQWKLEKNAISLNIKEITVQMGGYYVIEPSGYGTVDGNEYSMKTINPLLITIPFSTINPPFDFFSGIWVNFGGIKMQYIKK